jgi:hypothetical protein
VDGGDEEVKEEALFNDLLVPFELAALLKKVGEPGEIKDEDVAELELNYVHLNSITIISEPFFAEYIGRPMDDLKAYASDPGHHSSTLHVPQSTPGLAPSDYHLKRTQPGENLKTEESLFEKGGVLIGKIGTRIFLLKEHWDEWLFLPSNDEMKAYKKWKRTEIDKAAQGAKDVRLKPEDFKWNKTQSDEMMAACLGHNQDVGGTRLFSLVAVFSVDDVARLNSHKGKDASIELQFQAEWKRDEDDENEDAPELVIPFPGDMEREKFIDSLWETKKEGDEEGDDDGGEEDADQGEEEEEDEDEDGARSEKSEQEIGMLPYY